MTKQTINRGTAANDGTGDNLRAGAAKVNENFDELYNVLGDGTTLQPGDYITTSSTSIITNKTIDGSSNTITNIPNSALSSIDNAKLTNSNITITGDGAQTSAVDLGDTLTIEGGTGITTSVTADKVSISIDGAVLTEDSSDVLTNKTISGSTNTLSSIANTSLANSTVSYGGVQLNLGGVDATPAFDLADATNYPTSSLSGTITNAQLAGSIANAKLSNSSITVTDGSNSTATALGGTITFTAGEGMDVTEGSGTITFAGEDATTSNKGIASFTSADFSVASGAVSLVAERIQDIVGAMVGSNTETRITVTYDDSAATLNFVVDNDLSNYDNSSSGFTTASSTTTFTNKTLTSPKINEDVVLTANASELNLLDGVSGLVQADLTKLAAVDATAAELNIIDGDTSASSVTIVDADQIILNDNGTMKQVAVSALNSYTSASVAADDIGTGNAAVTLTTSSGNITIDAAANDSDVIFKGTDNTADITMLTLDGSDAGTATFNHDIILGNNSFVQFGDAGEKMLGDGTDLTINSSNDLNLTATTDINIPANVGLTFGDDAEKIEGDGTDLTIAGNNINLTAVADVNIPSGVGLTFATAEKIESDGTDLTVTSTGALNLTVTGTTTVSGALTVSGDMTVNGTTTTNNSVNLTVDDNIIELNSGISSSSNDIGFIFERGSTGNNAAIIWDESADKFSMGTTTNTAADKSGGITVSAGTLVANLEGDVTGDVTGTADVATAVTASANNSNNETVFITFVDGLTGTQGIETDSELTYNPSTNTLSTLATSAQYADVAERFAADAPMAEGAVVMLGGLQEITETDAEMSDQVFGVISSNPAYAMNAGAGNSESHPFVAMTGRTPVRVTGEVTKGQRLVSSSVKGCARAVTEGESITPFNVIGRALESSTDAGIKLVNCAVRTNN